MHLYHMFYVYYSNMLLMCVCSQSWVSQYFEVGLEVHIAVENINRREAYTKIREAADRLAPEFEFKIVDPLVGKYIPCPFLSARNGCDAECLQIVADKVVLTPGVKIFCERMEPVVPGEKVESGCALYSCSIKLPGSIERGLTVGHLFEDIGLECTVHCNSLSSSVSVGRCHTKITFVDLVDTLRKTTADLALLDVFCQVENTVVIDNVTYLLKLHHGFLNTKHCPRVAILSDSGQLRYGQVDSTLFTVSALGLYNTLSIVAPDNSWSRVNNPGDSGALVISVPDPKVGNELLVYGMVIGYFESDDGTQSKTVATRLGDILNYVNKMSQFHDAPCNLESGYMSFVSFE